MRKFAINGDFLVQNQTGVQRYAYNLIKALDKIYCDVDIVLVVSNRVKSKLDFKNIKIILFGYGKGIMWEQSWFALYTLLHNRMPINLSCSAPIFNCRGITAIHDIRNALHPEWIPKKFHAKAVAKWFVFQNWILCKFSHCILTVSEYAKQEIIDYYGIDQNRIKVICNAWQHILEYESAGTLQEKFSQLRKNDYYFSFGTIAEHKNFKWVLEVAKRNKWQKFVISGNLDKAHFDTKQIDDVETLPNVFYLGYLPDNEIKLIIENCKAFLFPSFYEGFGLPPLEALALGANVICSNKASMPEILEKSVHYIDPYDYEIDLEKILSEEIEPAEKVLEKYSWEKSADLLKELLGQWN